VIPNDIVIVRAIALQYLYGGCSFEK